MSNTSSRILRDAELSKVTPMAWHSTSTAPPAPRPARTPAVDAGAGEDPQQDEAKKESYQRGFSEGRTIGHDQAAAELQPVMDRLSRSLAELVSIRPRARKSAEADLLKLAIAIARRVLHRELTLDPGSIEGLIRVALEKLESRELCRVRVHPDQEPVIRTLLARFSAAPVELIPDPALQCGDVLFETAHGTLDGSIEAQLQEIERGFADRLRR
ncbi:MAG: Flagellar biosynthesis/type secretory pathway protein-like protein [Bryobacterales bacterium]|jgi:flagellar assembly protein FliH|nr:Flagellar biosynthesis/type secretory pathway protein-like protein [Bryobacterales bacterium]